MCSEAAIAVDDVSKCYSIYDRPEDRMKQFIVPRLQRLAGRAPSRYYRDFWALHPTSFSIRRGETIGIIGVNGSGKSTLLQIISGTVTPSSGRFRTSGRVAALLELGAGFNPEYTGRENAYFNAAVLGFPARSMEQRMPEVLAFAELGDFIDQPVRTYSSGMYARLAFAVAVHIQPEILVVDETLAVGDARFVAKCMHRIQDMRTDGVTILFVSHDLSMIRTVCDRVIWLDRGRVVEYGDVLPITARYTEFLFRDMKPSESPSAPDSSPRPDIAAPGPESAEAESAGLDARPVAHWGSHKGLILSAYLRDTQSRRKDVFDWNSELQVVIDLRVPPGISRDHLSVAFSIKDLKGTDLIVSTTRDVDGKRLPEAERFRVIFRMVNPLTTGKYVLVAAVEDRRTPDIRYYDYVEGAHYFASLSDARFFGIFQPRIDQLVMSS